MQESPESENEADRALFNAARGGDAAGVVSALDAGANVNARLDHGMTPLIAAVTNGHVAAAEALMDRGANLWMRYPLGHPFWIAQHIEKPGPMLFALLRRMTEFDVASKFFDAIERSDAVLVREILRLESFNVDSRDYKGDPATTVAAETWKNRDATFEIMKMLVAAGADVNAENAKGRTALDFAICDGSFGRERVALLLEAGADIYHRNSGGGTEYDLAREVNDPVQLSLIEPHRIRKDAEAFRKGTERIVSVRKISFRPG
jgi:ankyrin repeat protein